MGNLSTFQIALIGVFLFFGVVGVLGFSGVLPVPGVSQEGSLEGSVTIWGTFPERPVRDHIRSTFSGSQDISATYVEKDPETFDAELVNALASNAGPDLVFLPDDLVLKHKNKMTPISYSTMSQQEFRNTFIQQSDLYLSEEGIVALPMVVDPLVMYWNRNIYSSAGVPNAPRYWQEFNDIVPEITIREGNSDALRRSAVGLGAYRNIEHAKEILSAMILQSGTKIVDQNEEGYYTDINAQGGRGTTQATRSALRFFTQFSNANLELYTWNPSSPQAREMFVGGDLATYFGFASELDEITRLNPHLNFQTASLPQVRQRDTKATFGRMHGIAIVRSVENKALASHVAFRMMRSDNATAFARALSRAPARRNLLAQKPNDAHTPIFYDSALISRGWFDPDPSRTEQHFNDMIQGVVTGRMELSEAVSAFSGRLNRTINSVSR